MKPALIYPFLAISAAGFVLSTIEHLASLTGDSFLSPGQRTLLYIGIVIVALPSALASKALVGKTKKRDWRFELRATPQWIRYTVFVLVVYAIVNIVMLTDTFSSATLKGHPKQEDPNARTSVRANTAHAMAFYAIAFAVLYSALHVREYDRNRRCAGGHLVPPTEKVCPICGLYPQ